MHTSVHLRLKTYVYKERKIKIRGSFPDLNLTFVENIFNSNRALISKLKTCLLSIIAGFVINPSFYTLRLNRYYGVNFAFYAALDGLSLFFIIYFIIREIIAMKRMRCEYFHVCSFFLYFFRHNASSFFKPFKKGKDILLIWKISALSFSLMNENDLENVKINFFLLRKKIKICKSS